ncbi:MAG TPA: phage recombination protein Bet [Methylomirabilota bacterium]|nr:phage recombination protein Bet [Methylomirabilota bacterium]
MTLDQALELSTSTLVEFALIAATVGKEAKSLEQLVTFIVSAKARKLDLLSRQAYLLPFAGSDPVIHVGIDGARAIAAHTGQYAGSSDASHRGTLEITGNDGKKRSAPEKTLVTVWRMVDGRRCPFEATARWDEYYPGDGPRGKVWRDRPYGQLAKCAEMLALRKGFPSELGGIETSADDEPPLPTPRLTVAENARRYDKIFGGDDGGVVENGGHQVKVSTGEVVEKRRPRADILAEIRQVEAHARELGVKTTTRPMDTIGDEQLERYIDHLKAGIKAAEDEIFSQTDGAKQEGMI